MQYSLRFVRHLSRLVCMTLSEPDSHDAQLATIRALVAASSEGSVTISTNDWQLVVNGEQLPERFTGAQDLTAQLIGHSIVELIVDQSASPIDLVCVARILAREPVPGDGGRTIQGLLEMMRVETIRIMAEPPKELVRRIMHPTTSLGAGIPGMMNDSDTMSLFHAGEARPPGHPTDEEADAEPGDDEEDDDLVRDTDPETLFRTFSAVDESPMDSVGKLFARLDAAMTKPGVNIMPHLDALVKLGTESAATERAEVVADVFSKLMEREVATEDRSRRRLYGVALRRLSKPVVLNAVARLLSRRRENEEQYMAIMRRGEDAGVEALIDALIAAPSLADRRVYFDALLGLNSGVRMLIFMLGDDRWYVVRNAIELLGEMRVAGADSELTRLLDHEDDRVRSAAAAALAKLGTATAKRGLLLTVRDTADPEVRDRATELLSQATSGSGGAPSVDGLARALGREEDGRVQMAILSALAQIGTAEAVDRLASIASNEGGIFRKKARTPLRVAAVRALGEVQSPAATGALNALTRDREKEIRGAASWILMGRRKKKGS